MARSTYVNDEHGNNLEQWFYNKAGNLCLNADGVAGIKAKFDSVGNLIEYMNYDVKHQPCSTTTVSPASDSPITNWD